ncbi:hypothetical protein L9F63_013585, partial [Diploptera punctata]
TQSCFKRFIFIFYSSCTLNYWVHDVIVVLGETRDNSARSILFSVLLDVGYSAVPPHSNR